MSLVTVAYYREDGTIHSVAGVDSDLIATNQPSGTTALVVSRAPDFKTEYIKDGLITPRPDMGLVFPDGIVVGTDTPFTVENIPEGTEVIYPGGTEVVDDGDIEWESAVPGRFIFIFQNGHYLEKEVFVEVEEE